MKKQAQKSQEVYQTKTGEDDDCPEVLNKVDVDYHTKWILDSGCIFHIDHGSHNLLNCNRAP